MRFEFPRKTLREQVSFEGAGLHSGQPSRVRLHPDELGIAFRHGSTRMAAAPENVTGTARSTALGQIRTVEHLMSAFAGSGVTDVEVEVEGVEIPALDGSAIEFLEAIMATGLRETGARAGRLFARVNLHEDECRIGVSLGSGRWRYEFEREGYFVGSQAFEVELGVEAYRTEVAPARTFAFEEEIEALRAAGLGLGGNEENVLVIGRERYLTPSRFMDEAPRHKLLDCIGDLYLSGIPPVFLNVVAEKSGHRLNVEAAARLAEICEWED